MTASYAIIGMQYGSEAKGALAGYLGTEWKPDVVMANWSPNAGHTYINGEKIVRRCIPMGTVSSDCERVLLGPGSIIDPSILEQEAKTINPEIQIIGHPQAAIVTQDHRNQEIEYLTEIGSTLKGAGAAAIERMRRHPMSHNTAANWSRSATSHA